VYQLLGKHSKLV